MAGRNQHYIPRFLQKAFGIRPKRKEIWYFSRGEAVERRPIKRTGSENSFYSEPTFEEQTTLDDVITRIESDIAASLNEVRRKLPGDVVAPPIAAAIISHLAQRTAHVRTTLSEGVARVLERTEKMFAERELAKGLIGLDDVVPTDRFRELAMSELVKTPEITSLGIPRRVLERFAFVIAKEKSGELAERASVLLDVLQRRSAEMVRDSHNKALGGAIGSAEYGALLQALDWKVESGPATGAILPDCVVIAFGPEAKVGNHLLVGADKLQALVISVADREGDIWGLYARQAEDPAAAGLLVRACRSKQRKVLVDGKKVDLGKHMDTLPPCASRSIEISARGGRAARKKRKAVLALRIARVELIAPEGKSPHTLPMTAVLVAERNPPSGARQPLRWLLLCSEGEATPEWADRIRQWYETRWSIEEFFRVLKTGTRIEDRRLDDAEDLRKCLAFDAITAWRVFDLDRAARETPDRPADEIMSRDEIFMLYLGLYDYRVIRCRAPPDYIPDLRTFAIDLGRYVGFIPSKRQPMPGTAKLWTGMTYLMQDTAALQRMRRAGMLRETRQ